MIEMRKLRDLVKLMKENDLCELDLRDKDEQVTLKRPGASGPVYAAPPPVPAPAAPVAASVPAAPAPAEDAGLVTISSPMVGTYYSAPSPDADAFVRTGSAVTAETVVCIIEAMKVFNEIKAETFGVIAKVLVESGQAVEFGEPLFLVKPN